MHQTKEQTMARLNVLALALGLVVAVGCLGCGGNSGNEPAGQAAADTINIDEPPAFLLYPGATLSGGYTLPGSDGHGAGWLLETDSTMAQVWDWYDTWFHELDWPEGSAVRSDESQLMVWTSEEEQETVTILLVPRGDATTISLTYVRK